MWRVTNGLDNAALKAFCGIPLDTSNNTGSKQVSGLQLVTLEEKSWKKEILESVLKVENVEKSELKVQKIWESELIVKRLFCKVVFVLEMYFFMQRKKGKTVGGIRGGAALK